MSRFVEQYISNFVKNQFPSFYEKEGPVFILFMEAYYEWLEQDGNAVGESRNLFEYRDIDTTISNNIEDFLGHFQQKYLYGIPYNIISNKRFLLKHIQDIYRSKGTDRCYKLLFRLIYNEDIDIYKPAYDMLKVSDGTWIQPEYLEVTDAIVLDSLKGKQIVGSVSNTVATVESVNREPLNNNITASLYISNVFPEGADFVIGEKVLQYPNTATYSLFDAPSVIGSIDYISILNGGDGFSVGDILTIAEKDPITGQTKSFGVNGKVKVSDTARSQGTLQFYVSESGAGITPNTTIYFDKAVGDNSGYGATFDIGPLSYAKRYTYNTDLIYDYRNTALNAVSFSFPADPSANVSDMGSGGTNTSPYPLSGCLTFQNNIFGSVYSLTNINPGNNYIYSPSIFIRSSLISKPINIGTITYSNTSPFQLTLGEITYNTATNVITGNNTTFSTLFVANDVIALASSRTGGINEYHVIQSVDSNTQITINEVPTHNSTPTAAFFKVPSILGSGTGFTSLYVANDAIGIQADASDDTTREFQMIKHVANDTCLILYGTPDYNSTATADYYIAPSLMRSQFALYEPPMYMTDGTIPGENSFIGAIPNNGNNIVSAAISYDSGKGYLQGETIDAYLFNGIITPEVVEGGTGYSNGEQLVFTGGTSSVMANGFITTNTSGGIVQCTLINMGANYTSVPLITIDTSGGSGAELTTRLAPPTMLNTYSKVTGRIVKRGIGKSPGYWSTTRSFLNSDKYIQDSYFYQDYSYQIRAANTLDKYKQIIYDTFHSSGMELFGEFYSIDILSSKSTIVKEIYEKIEEVFFTVDSELFTCDADYVTCDEFYQPVSTDTTDFSTDNEFLTADSTYLVY